MGLPVGRPNAAWCESVHSGGSVNVRLGGCFEVFAIATQYAVSYWAEMPQIVYNSRTRILDCGIRVETIVR